MTASAVSCFLSSTLEDLLSAVKNANQEEVNECLAALQPSLNKMAAQKVRRASDGSILAAKACETLMEAAHSFDPDHATPFEHYAKAAIKRAFIDELRALDCQYRRNRGFILADVYHYQSIVRGDEERSSSELTIQQQDAIATAFEDVKKLLHSTCHQFQKKYGGNYEDHFSLAQEIFLKAYDQFDHEKGMRFSTFVRQRVWWRLQDEVRHQAQRQQALPRESSEVLLHIGVIPSEGNELEHQESMQVVQNRLDAWMKQRSPRHQQYIQLHFHNGLKKSAIARQMGITRGAVTQIHDAIVRDGRRDLPELRDYLAKAS